MSEVSVGQSYQLNNNNYIQANQGISKKFSDFVGNLKIKPTEMIELSSTFSLDQEKFSLKMHILILFLMLTKTL